MFRALRQTARVSRQFSTHAPKPVLISVAITGDCHDNSRAPVPLTPEEQVAEAKRAFEAGARLVHLHVRDDKGRATADVTKYHACIERLRKEVPELLVEFSTSNFAPTIEEQKACLSLNPDLASVTPGSTNLNSPRPNVPIYINTHASIDALVAEMKARKIKPNLGIFDVSMLYNAYKLWERNLIEPPFRFIFVLGGYMALPARRSLLEFLVNEANDLFGADNYSWSTVGVAWNHKDVVSWTLDLDGHPRTGFEDTLMLDKGVYANSNAELVEQVVRMAKERGRPIATPEQARQIVFGTK